MLDNTKDILTLKELQELLHIKRNGQKNNT